MISRLNVCRELDFVIMLVATRSAKLEYVRVRDDDNPISPIASSPIMRQATGIYLLINWA